MADKLKFAFMLAGGCAGCETALVDTSEKLVDALDHLEVVFWAPTVADVKYKDLEAMPDKSIDLAFVDGMIRNTENEHMVKVLRDKSKILVAFGACASLGGIAAMGDLHTHEELFEQAYKKTFSTENPEGIYPSPQYTLDGKYDLTLPALTGRVSTIDQLVEVDYFMGGCPPHHDFIAAILGAVLSGNLPPKGSWLTGGKAVCDVCKRNPANEDKERTEVLKVFRTVEGRPDDGKCLLQQGYVCFGPFTQGDCNASCLKVNIPCRGCGGPIPGVSDYGARAISAIGSILGDEKAAQELMDKYPDMAKFVYRYSLSSGKLCRNLDAFKGAA
jgi:F420-non-reducing hydrogenase small subunit